MTEPEAPPAAPVSWTPGRLVLRATLWGVLVTGGLVGVLLVGLPADMLPGNRWSYMLAGVAVGVLAGTLGNVLVVRGALFEPADPRSSTAFIRAVVMDFALQFFAVVGSTLGLFLAAVKFPDLATFGIALAGVAAVFRVPGTVVVTRALTARAKARAGAVPTATGPVGAGARQPFVQDSSS